MSRRKIAAGNWKMNTTVNEGRELLSNLSKSSIPDDVEMILCVPFTHLSTLVQGAPGHIEIGAQNMYFEDKGAFTGEVSALVLKDIGVEYVLVGHSERREYFNEGGEMLAKKLSKALEHGLNPIFCCGEHLAIRKANEHIEFVKSQLEQSLFHVSRDQMAEIILAYEPIWAIGTGETASPQEAEEMHSAIRSMINAKYGDRVAENVPILYGGSVKPRNAKELFSQQDVDGGLVGGASLDPVGFTAIANSF